MVSRQTSEPVGPADVITYVFAYNRPALLSNLLASWALFGHGQIVVVDDASTETAQRELLASLDKQGVTVLSRGGDTGNRLGGLHRNMDAAIRHASAGGYRFAHFLQDDMQLVAPMVDSFAEALCVFDRHPDAAQALLTFHKLLGHHHPVAVEGCSYRHEWAGVVDTGVLHLERLRSAHFVFAESEHASSERMLATGNCAYFVWTPCVAWVPWPVAYRDRQRTRRRVRLTVRYPVARRALLLRPLTAQQRALLSSPVRSGRPVHERWCKPWGWVCVRPYAFRDEPTMRWCLRMFARAVSTRDVRLLPTLTGRL